MRASLRSLYFILRSKLYNFLIKSPLFSIGIYFFSIIGLMLCYSLYSLGGFILYPIFYFLNCWPLMLIKFIDLDLHIMLLGKSDPFLNGQIISLISWLLISPLLIVTFPSKFNFNKWIVNITIQWKRRISITMFNSSIKSIPSFPCAPHCGRYA